MCAIGIYIDDMIIIGNKYEIINIINNIKKKFKILKCKSGNFLLRIKIVKTKNNNYVISNKVL